MNVIFVYIFLVHFITMLITYKFLYFYSIYTIFKQTIIMF